MQKCSNIRIAIYIPSLSGGGAERVMVTLANSFAARGYMVDLVLVKAQGPYLKDVAKNVQIIDLKATRVLYSLSGLVSYLRRKRPMVMLSAMLHANVIAVIARGVARTSMRVVVSEHSNFSSAQIYEKSFRGRAMR